MKYKKKNHPQPNTTLPTQPLVELPQRGRWLDLSSHFRYPSYWALGLVLLVVVAYANTLGHSYVFDDYPTIVENAFVKKGLAGLPEIFSTRLWDGYDVKENIQSYRPITLATFALEHQFFGLAPSMSHLVNLLVYLASVLLIYRLFYQLIGQPNSSLPWLIAAFFALHPLHTEPVNNLKSRDELLALAFGLAAILYYIKYVRQSHHQSAIWCALFYLLALLSKETPITFIALAPSIALFFRLKSWQMLLWRAWPLAVAAIIFLVVRYLVIQAHSTGPQTFTYFDQPMLLANTWSLSYGTKLWVLGKNLSLLVFPYPLTSSYFYNDIPIVPIYHPMAILTLAATIGLFWLAYYGWKAGQLYGLGLVVFFITFSLFSHFIIPMGNAMGERLLLTPSLGACIFFAYLANRFLGLLPGQGGDINDYFKSREPVLIILIGLGLICLNQIIDRNRVWQNNFSLASNDVVTSPESYLLNRQAALEYAKAEKQTMSLLARKQTKQLTNKYFVKALQLDSTNIDLYKRYISYLYQGQQLEEALDLCERAGKVKGANQEELKLTKAKLLIKKGEYELARQALTQIKPTDLSKELALDLFIQAGILSTYTKKYQEAVENFRGAYAYASTPDQQGFVLNHLGNTYLLNEQLENAKTFYVEALKAFPKYAEPYLNLGVIAFKQAKVDIAMNYFTEALKIDPKYALAHKNLALAYQQKGDQASYQYHLDLYNKLNN
jgi:protein O-mannosyl-transferase